MSKEAKSFTHFTFPKIKEKAPLISNEELLSGESTEELIVSLGDGLKQHKEQVERDCNCEIEIVIE